MHILGSILNLLDSKMSVPALYGWFHTLCFIASILFGLMLYKRHPIASETFIRRLLLGVSVVVMMMEVYKQINFSFHYDGSTISFDYQWYAFPFQFCSTIIGCSHKNQASSWETLCLPCNLLVICGSVRDDLSYDSVYRYHWHQHSDYGLPWLHDYNWYLPIDIWICENWTKNYNKGFSYLSCVNYYCHYYERGCLSGRHSWIWNIQYVFHKPLLFSGTPRVFYGSADCSFPLVCISLHHRLYLSWMSASIFLLICKQHISPFRSEET